MTTYVLKNGLLYGPYDIEELREQLDLGVFKSENFASIDNCQNWLRIEQLSGIEAPSFNVKIDESRNLLLIRYRGRVELRDIERCLEKVGRALSKLARGFELLADFTELQRMDPACAPVVAEIMDLCNEAGVATVVRIIPQAHQDIGLQIMSLFHYRNDVEIATCSSRNEAKKILDRHEHSLPADFLHAAAAGQEKTCE